MSTSAKGCSKYCLRSRKNAKEFSFPNPSPSPLPSPPFPLVELKAAGVTAPPGGYQARTHYEKLLQAWLEGGTSVAFALWGLGGSGKSTLSRNFAATSTRLAKTDAAPPLRLVFLLTASTMDHDYLRLLTELEIGGGSDRNSTVGNNKRSQDENRQRVHPAPQLTRLSRTMAGGGR